MLQRSGCTAIEQPDRATAPSKGSANGVNYGTIDPVLIPVSSNISIELLRQDTAYVSPAATV